LARAGAARVHACEINPNSVEALRRNLALNKVPARGSHSAETSRYQPDAPRPLP
jgi:tRNA G37 N-methylase Trm5